MSRQRHPREVIVHCTVTFPDMKAVKEWLREHQGSAARSNLNAAEDCLRAFIVSNADWDNIPLTCSCVALTAQGGAA